MSTADLMAAYTRQQAADRAQGIARCDARNLKGARASEGSYALTQSARYWPALDWCGKRFRLGAWEVAGPNPFRPGAG